MIFNPFYRGLRLLCSSLAPDVKGTINNTIRCFFLYLFQKHFFFLSDILLTVPQSKKTDANNNTITFKHSLGCQ